MTSRFTRFQTRGLGRALAASGALAALGWCTPASAHEQFPSVLQSIFKNQCAVQCTLCHTAPEGGLDKLKPSLLSTGAVPLVSPGKGNGEFFANLVRVWANGQKPRYPNTDDDLKAAITALQTTPCDLTTPNQFCDSDGDGVSDTKELAADSDPDTADKPGDYCVGPKYGCGAHIGNLPRESIATREATLAISLLGLGLVFLRRARRR